MKPTLRIATGIAAALALLVAPATYARDDAAHATSRSAPCACMTMAEHAHCGAKEHEHPRASQGAAADGEHRAERSAAQRQDSLRH